MIKSIIFLLISFLIEIIVLSKDIKYLKKKNSIQFIRTEGPRTHFKKFGTPTGGGLIIIVFKSSCKLGRVDYQSTDIFGNQLSLCIGNFHTFKLLWRNRRRILLRYLDQRFQLSGGVGQGGYSCF